MFHFEKYTVAEYEVKEGWALNVINKVLDVLFRLTGKGEGNQEIDLGFVVIKRIEE